MSSAPARILIVEDQRLIAADLAQTLTRLGYEVVASVASGEEAVAKALELHPDLALMDIRLRGAMDGIEAAKAIHQHNDMPIIYLTAYADEETIRRAMITGPLGYLVKPFNERELRAAIEIAIYKHATEQRLAEERARRAAAEEFRLLIDAAFDYAIFSLDAAGRVTSWNTGAQRITGYAPEEVIGKHWSLFHPEESVVAGQPAALLAAAARDGQTATEGWRVRKDGTGFWASVSLNALAAEHGHRGFGIIIHDITVRREVERALERSAAQLAAMVGGALDAIISIDAAGRVVEWNPAAERIFGYTREEAIGHELAELIVPARLRRAHEQGLARFRADGEERIIGRRVELPAVRKDGAELIIELNVIKLPIGQPTLFTGFLRDITERKYAEHAQTLLDRATVVLASSLEVDDVLASAVEIPLPDLADGCLVDLVDAQGQLVQVACSHVEPRTAELARQLAAELKGHQALEPGPQRVFRTGVAEVHPERRALPLGADHPARLRALGVVAYVSVPIRFRGKIQGVLSLIKTSGSESFTAADLALCQELARRVGLAIDNAKHYRQAQAAIRARDEFFQIASHELKTPLTPLGLALETLGLSLQESGASTVEVRSKLQLCMRQVARLNRLVDALLDVSRITSGKLALELESFDLAVAVREVVERFRSEAERSRTELRVKADHPVVGRWDRLRVEQIVSNLISNAIKYGTDKPVEVEVAETETSAKVIVKDRGIGIDPAALERIFGRFERAASMRHYGGLGLGLFISRQLAQAHGGDVSADSMLGAGATFTLTLPRQTIMRGAEQ